MSPFSQRMLAALGGTAGAIPLLPLARRLAERLVGPARLAGAELARGDAKAATYAEAAVLVLALPAAAFLCGHELFRRLRSRGGYAALPGVALSSSLFLWMLGVRPKICLIAGACGCGFAFVALLLGTRSAGPHESGTPRVRRRRTRGVLAAVVLLAVFAGAWHVYWRRDGPIDLFEDGQLLAPAETYLRGGRPYQDTYPVHGWGADGGVDAVAFRIFSPTLKVFRARRATTTALAAVLLAIACWTLFRRPGAAAIGLALAFGLCPFLSERQALAFGALAGLIAAAREGRLRLWALAGALSAATLFFTLDFGLILLVAGVLTAGACGLGRRAAAAAGPLAGFLMGATAACLPFLVLLGHRRSLGAFFRVSFGAIPSQISEVWGLPAGSPAAAFRGAGLAGVLAGLAGRGQAPWLFSASVVAASATVLLFRAVGQGLGRTDRGALAATTVAAVALRGVLGRADAGHLALYGIFAALPAAWLLWRALRSPEHREVLTLAVAVPLILRVEPLDRARIVQAVLSPPAMDTECARAIFRGGGSRVPCAQADDLAELRDRIDSVLAPDQTFFDFSSEPALFFLLERRPPVAFCCAPFFQSEEDQRRVIEELERERPPLAILSSGTDLDAFDGVPSRSRAPLVAAYLDTRYEAYARVGTRTIGRRRSDQWAR